MLPDWEIWLDNQLSSILAKWMYEECQLVVKSAFILQIREKTDSEIFKMAKATGNVILITKDADFTQLILQSGAPPKVIKLNTGNISSIELWNRYKSAVETAIHSLQETDAEIIYIEPTNHTL